MDLKVTKLTKPLRGGTTVPGDKSISHRAVMFNSIAEGSAVVRGFLESADCLSTVEAMRALGVEIERSDPGVLWIEGRGLGGLVEPDDVIDVGNSGTTMRLLPGILAGQDFYTVLTGDSSIRRRPMGRIVEPLRRMGCEILGREGDSLAPLTIRGGELRAVEYRTAVASAQVKSAIILAGLYADGVTSVTEPALSRDHTERMLSSFGADLGIDGTTVRIAGGKRLIATDVDVPGDISSAAFILGAALLVGGSEVSVSGVGVNPTRTGMLDVLGGMGAEVRVFPKKESAGEAIADLYAVHTPLEAFEIDGALVPRLIDEIPILAVMASQATGRSVIRGARELRVKESDRIAAISSNLRKMGCHVEEREDGMAIDGPVALKGARIETHGDHRIAMAFAVAGLLAQGETIITSAECMNVSFPGFMETIEGLQ